MTVIAAVLIAFLDWLRPASSRTHLGNFFQSVLDGRLFSVIGNKMETNLHLLANSNYTFIVLRGLLRLLLVLLPALTFHSQGRLASFTSPSLQGAKQHGDLAPAQPSSVWLRLKALLRMVVQKTFALHERYWSWLFPRSAGEATTTRWPAFRIVFIVELVVFVLSFALNDSGIVLPAMALLLLLPMLTSFVIGELPASNSQES